jgi:hypothetical protein
MRQSDRRTGSRLGIPAQSSQQPRPALGSLSCLMIYDRVIMMQRLCYFKDKLIHSSSFFLSLLGEQPKDCVQHLRDMRPGASVLIPLSPSLQLLL